MNAAGGEVVRPPDLRAFKFCLDPTPTQISMLRQHAGAARFAYNYAIAAKVESHRKYRELADEATAAGMDVSEAKKWVKERAPKIPRKADIQKLFNAARGDDRAGVDGVAPWWHTVSTYAFQSAWADADRAWQNWLDSLSGKRSGRPAGYPRFKSRARARSSVRLYGGVRLDGYRRIVLPRLGSVRISGHGRRLAAFLETYGGRVKAVTVSRTADRWYASLLIETAEMPDSRPTRRQRENGLIGVDLGVRHLATLSTGETVPNPRYLDRGLGQLRRAQKTVARAQKGSANRAAAVERVAKLHRLVAQRRATAAHALTKMLATKYAAVAVEALAVGGMLSGDGDGEPRTVKRSRNRALSDAALGSIKHQLAYKTDWYGSSLILVDAEGHNSRCSECGAERTKVPPSRPDFHCPKCGVTLPRGLNSARNIKAVAQASGQNPSG